MSIYSISFLVLFVFIVLPITLYVKIRSWGLSISTTFVVMYSCVFSIPKIHIHMYNMYKNKNKKVATKLLLLPLSNPRLVLALYSKSAIMAEAKYKAIESIVPTLNNREFNIFSGILDEEGLEIKVKNKKLKKLEVSELDKRPEKIPNKKLWEKVFTQEVGETFQNEFNVEYC